MSHPEPTGFVKLIDLVRDRLLGAMMVPVEETETEYFPTPELYRRATGMVEEPVIEDVNFHCTLTIEDYTLTDGESGEAIYGAGPVRRLYKQYRNPHQAWCDRHGYTDAFWQEGHWWAFPPNGVMPVRINDVRIAADVESSEP